MADLLSTRRVASSAQGSIGTQVDPLSRFAPPYNFAVVTLRLFAQLREIAGTGRVEIDAADLQSVIEAASERFGAEFRALLESAAIWVDGQPWAEQEGTTLRPGSEVALVPPVSGGGA